MFKLQRLEITGFKSFADYTEIVFTGSGITAVVGPNGCGKSNVSDAISWVLGEQRAKSLRGEEMKDVIFQGTNKRNPGGMAEVVLHLVRDETEFLSDDSELEDIDEKLGEIDEHAVDVDVIEADLLEEEVSDEETFANTAHGELNELGEEADIEEEAVKVAQVGSVQTIEKKVKTRRRWKPRNFALDFAPGEAVSVTRRLYLSGESEYLLNDKSCRLRDIQDLFSGTGLSGSHYAIIEQGRIGQILSSKPSSRRELIEEAAGISKFRKRQRAAESRLESAKTNLGRITDIVSEVEKQVRSLQRQANKTKRYKILREELRTLLKRTYAAEGAGLSERVNEITLKLEEAGKTEREIQAQAEKKDLSFRNATAAARTAEETLTKLRSEHSESAIKRDRAKRDHEHNKTQIKEINLRSEHLDAEIRVTEERIRLLKNELERLEKAAEKEGGEADIEQRALLDAELIYRKKSDELRSVELKLEEERTDFLEHTAAVERLAEVDRQFESNLEKLRERIEGLRRENERAEEVYVARKKEFEKLGEGINEERTKLDGLQKENEGLLNSTKKAREELANDEKMLAELREVHSRQKHRLETLNELEEKHAIYAPNVQKLFAEEKKVGVKFNGTLAERLVVDEKAERAVENLFGSLLETIIVDSVEDAKRVVKYLNNNNLGRVPVLVLDPNDDSANDERFGENRIGALMGLKGALAKTLREIFPRELEANIVNDIDDPKVKKGGLFATFSGDFSYGGRLFIGGSSVVKNAQNSSLLAFKREQRELAKQFEKSLVQVDSATNEVEKARAKLNERENELVDLRAFIVQVERELLSQEIHAKSLSQEIERADRHKKVITDEREQIENEIRQIEKRRVESAQNAKTAEKAKSLSSEKIENINADLQKSRRAVEAESAVLGQKRTRAEVAAERKRAAQNSLNRVKTENEEFEARLERQKRETGENQERALKLNDLREKLSAEISNAKSEIEEEEIALEAAIAHLKLSRESSDLLSNEVGELNKRSAEARDQRSALQITNAEVSTRLQSLEEKCLQDLNVSLDSLVSQINLHEEFDLAESKREAEDLRDRLENFGAINMLALEELGTAEERCDFLTRQHDDIVDSIRATEDALKEIKRRSRQRFKDAFETINANFREFFVELFGGGTGEMTLLEADDILDSGIEIAAQPPGKRLQNMLLLSGGEKAMTAISLVLAIFKYRPSPFCLLDEVDAPLDEANVGRFVSRIDSLSENTQFIVITHNKRTMEAAKALYGVTMQEAGVSKIVSVRFE
ncbi:MAG: chromosome segregation protein SMC [Pyrinomonadaceae bacterium]